MKYTRFSFALPVVMLLVISCNEQEVPAEPAAAVQDIPAPMLTVEYSTGDTLDHKYLTEVMDSSTMTRTMSLNGALFTGLSMQDHGEQGYFVWHIANGKLQREEGYYPNQKPHRIVEMKDGKEHGICLMWYPNGNKYIEEYYDNGRPIDTWYRWSEDGTLEKTTKY